MIKSFGYRVMIFIMLALTIDSLSIFNFMPVHPSTAISHPGGRIFEVTQAGNFILRYRFRWDEVGVNGFYNVGIYWDCPENHPYENFTVLYNRVYFDDDGDNLPDPGVDPIDNATDFSWGPGINGTRWTFIVYNETGDPRDGYFNVDIYMRAASGDGTPHVLTDNHPIWHSMDSLLIAESNIVSIPAGVITIRVIPFPPPNEGKGYSPALLIAISLALLAVAIFAAIYFLRKSRKVVQRKVLMGRSAGSLIDGMNVPTSLLPFAKNY